MVRPQVDYLVRPPRRRRGRAPSFIALRMGNLYRLFEDRYGGPLHDDDDGRDNLAIMLHHLANTRDDERRMRETAGVWAPWLTGDELDETITKILARPKRFKADTLGKRLNISDEERTRLQLWTLGTATGSSEQRKANQRERRRAAQEHRRRAAGAMTANEYRALRKSRRAHSTDDIRGGTRRPDPSSVSRQAD